MKKIKFKIKKERLLFLIVFLSLIGLSKFLNLVLVNGNSMYPTYHDKNLLTSVEIQNHNEEINVDDIVVFTLKDEPDFLYIKRVVGKPNDTLEIKDGKLYRNDKKVKDDFPKIEEPGILNKKIKLKKNEYFCMGDNRNYSTDCREFGPITKDRITHKIRNKFLGPILN